MKTYNWVGRISVLFLFAIIQGGCSNSTTPSNSNSTPTVVVPNVGTNWTYYYTLTDTSGTKLVNQDTSVRTIDATGLTYRGDTGVVRIIEVYKKLGTRDTTYIRYLASGDLSRATDATFLPEYDEWFTIPYYSHASQSNPLSLATMAGTSDTAFYTINWLRNETQTVGTTNYQASVISSTIWQHITSSGKDSTRAVTTINTFIPQYGIYGNRTTSSSVINGKKKDLGTWTLVAVDIK